MRFLPLTGQNPEFGVSNQAVTISNKLKHDTVSVSEALVTTCRRDHELSMCTNFVLGVIAVNRDH